MERFELMRELNVNGTGRIVLLLLDGLGGLPMEHGGQTELEAAHTPNLDALAAEGICGLHDPIGPGITPGSGPSHLAVFGYDPLRYVIGRGVLESVGVDFPLEKEDVAARGNFCSVDESGRVTDRRAGRIATELNRELCGRLRSIALPGVEVFVETVKEYRFILVLRGEGLSGAIADTDPQRLGALPLEAEPLAPEAEATARLANEFIKRAAEVLRDQRPGNMVLLRGFSMWPEIPSMQDVFGLNPASIAVYPMYRGVARLVGMKPLQTGQSIADEFGALVQHFTEHDFFYLHVKKTDSAGEDGDFDRKVALLEEVDEQVPRLMALDPDVVIVTGDHSTPALLRAHSWHPVPVLIRSRHCGVDDVDRFSERACASGALGRFPATDIMPIALANALRLGKYGA
jgi:2,3-bisphosphoglycerate-independent phosphoglycerate mutase